MFSDKDSFGKSITRDYTERRTPLLEVTQSKRAGDAKVQIGSAGWKG